MNEDKIRKLIKLVEESEIDQLEINSWGRKVRITRRLAGRNGNSGQPAVIHNVPASAPVPAPAPAAATTTVAEEAAAEADKKYVEVKSPMVGTFYSAPAPDTAPYITANQNIEVGQVVCIVEAMKLMNEIESEVSGRVARIMVENAQPVEFGQVLYLIDPQG